MTYSHTHRDNQETEIDRECLEYGKKNTKLKKILLECGEGTGAKTFRLSNDTPFQLAHVSLDTTYLNRPEVLIKFSSLVNVEVVGILLDSATVRLKYELFRVCEGGEPLSLGTWVFEKVNVFRFFITSSKEAFSFIFCDTLTYHGCCDYFVTVTPIEIADATVTISNGRIASLSQSSCYSSMKNKDCVSKNKNAKSDQNHAKPKEILLECGQGNGSIPFRASTDPSANIAHVIIDTTYLNKPEVLIEFSTIIKLEIGILDLSLQFELFRVCGDGEPVSRGIWKFEKREIGGTLPTGLDEAFNFIFCEPLTYPGCCEYFVTVTVLELEVEFAISDGLVLVQNGRMAAIAQSSRDYCNYNDQQSFDENYDSINCKSKHPKPKKIILECGSGTGSKAFVQSSEESPFQLAQVTIDTTSLCKPLVNIEFSSIISFEALDLEELGVGRLQYELFRVSNNKRPISLGIWSIGRRVLGILIEKETSTFDFTFCDCVTCPSCCDYFVTVTPVGLIGNNFTITASNGRIVALAQEA